MPAAKPLRQLAGEEGSHARRLMGVYYLVTGCCYQPRLQGGRVERLPWREVLRTRYHAETCGGLRYAQAAEATEDVCLREIWEELSAAEYRHARQLLSCCQSRRTASDDCDGFARTHFRDLRSYPSVLIGCLNNRTFVFLCGHRFSVYITGAGCFAECRADT